MSLRSAPAAEPAVAIARLVSEEASCSPLADVRPLWFHPLLLAKSQGLTIARDDIEAFSYDFYLRFLPFFRGQDEGCLAPGIVIEFSSRMRQKLGLAYLFEHRIKLNLTYFQTDPSLLPYTLFHEMTHLWLYDCLLDPGHTWRFYAKMREFERTGLPVDPTVHVHARAVPESKHVYSCPNCKNRWYLRERLRYSIYCGHCFERENIEYYPQRLAPTAKNLLPQSANEQRVLLKY